MGKEIERKFLIKEIPFDLYSMDPEKVIQSYLAIGEEEVRLRKTLVGSKAKCVMTIKKGKGLVREEREFPIEELTYAQLLQGSTKKPIIKNRFVKVIDGYEYVIDLFLNESLSRLITAEVEFESVEDANEFVKPIWLGEEVTEDKAYKNQSLWKSIQ